MCKTILKGIKNMKHHRDAHLLQPNFPPLHQDLSADAVPPSGNEFPGMPPIPPPPEATSRDQVHGSWDSWLGSNSWGWPQTTSGPGPSWSRDEPATWCDPRSDNWSHHKRKYHEWPNQQKSHAMINSLWISSDWLKFASCYFNAICSTFHQSQFHKVQILPFLSPFSFNRWPGSKLVMAWWSSIAQASNLSTIIDHAVQFIWVFRIQYSWCLLLKTKTPISLVCLTVVHVWATTFR